jgi:flavin-dependent dehydrogenase
MIAIAGAGLSGRVLHHELKKRGVSSQIADRVDFPRQKVCGGVLQADSWEYLNKEFKLSIPHHCIESVSFYWKGKKYGTFFPEKPMVQISRFFLDEALVCENSQRVDGSANLEVDATGAHTEGGWLGFQSEGPPVDELEMHLSADLYLGLAPSAKGAVSHAAFLVRKTAFKSPEQTRELVQKKLGVRLAGPMKGAGCLQYPSISEKLSVGDAKFLSHPILGFGMTHAIDSSRLLARLIAENRAHEYAREHADKFKAAYEINRVIAALFQSRSMALFSHLLRSRSFIQFLYGRLHRT